MHHVLVSDCPVLRAVCLDCDWRGIERLTYSGARGDAERHAARSEYVQALQR